ncbi:serine hydrolase [Streptomyces sp. NPDC096032]|uniref:serine hydrolase n=1 Tax=Streptomyces sp. NPDC096032 TaxID=3366070 RepID=UPI0038175301
MVPNGKHITVRQLLSHRSGLYDYTDSLWHGNLTKLYQNRFRHWTPGNCSSAFRSCRFARAL